MKCNVSSNTTHGILIGNEIGFKSYKEICHGEKIKVNLGFFNDSMVMLVENNTLMQSPKQDFIFGKYAQMSRVWQVLLKFFSNHNIEPNWLDCKGTPGWYDEDLGGWTGCMGKV